MCGWAFVGFDASASVAEETAGAGSNVPKAIIGATAAVGGLVVLVAGAITLAATDLQALVSGEIADPVTAVVTGSLGAWSGAAVLRHRRDDIPRLHRVHAGLYRPDRVRSCAGWRAAGFRRLSSVSAGSKAPVAAMSMVT